MKIEDNRRDNPPFVDVRDDSIKIGDFVETEKGYLCLIVWADKYGHPYGENPGYQGLLYLPGCMSSINALTYPRVRKVNAKIVVEDREK